MVSINSSYKEVDITFTEGDDNTISIVKRHQNGDRQDITGWEFWLTIKDNRGVSDSNADLQKSVTSHTDPKNGETNITLSSSETDGLEGRFVYDMQYKDNFGNIKTFMSGTAYFNNEVTEAK